MVPEITVPGTDVVYVVTEPSPLLVRPDWVPLCVAVVSIERKRPSQLILCHSHLQTDSVEDKKEPVSEVSKKFQKVSWT